MQNGLQVLSVINQFRNVIAAALDDLGLFGGEAELGEMRRGCGCHKNHRLLNSVATQRNPSV